MKRKNTVPWFELGNIGPNLMNNTGNIISGIPRFPHHLRKFPVFWVGPTDYHLNNKLVIIWLWDRDIDDGHLGSYTVLWVNNVDILMQKYNFKIMIKTIPGSTNASFILRKLF